MFFYFWEETKMTEIQLQTGDELRGNSSHGSVHLFRGGADLGLIGSGMKLMSNLGFQTFSKDFANSFGSKVRLQNDPWISQIE
jgi:hypothetical protein